MLYYLIVCRALTHAQKISAALDRAGIPNRVLRAPKAVAGEGCSHCVQISPRHLPQFLDLARQSELQYKRIYVTAGDGNYEEVPL